MGIPDSVRQKLNAQMEGVRQMTPALANGITGMDMTLVRAGYV